MQHVIQIKNRIIKHVYVNVKIIIGAKKIIVGILAHLFVRIASISIVDTLVIMCDEIVYVMDIVSTKMTNTVATNASIIMHH